jgi:hypothetical protein
MVLRSALTLVATASLLTLSGCQVSGSGMSLFAVIRGSGVPKTEERQVGEFSRIQVRGSTDVVVSVGPATKVSVTADDNIVGHVTTEVDGDTLEISMKSGNYSTKTDTVVHVAMPRLEALGISGSADATIEGMSGGSLDLSITGSGDIEARGRVDELEASISGSGDMSLYGLESQRAEVSITGSGDIEVNAKESLDASVSGSGDIRYRGQPKTTKKAVHGSGDISDG